MAKPEWGMKHTCQHCGALFYDMRKTPPTCPKCGAEQEVEKPRARRGAAAAEPARAAATPKPAVVEDEAELEVDDAVLETDEDEEEEEFIEDASDIGDDEDDMAGMIEGIEEGGEEKE